MQTIEKEHTAEKIVTDAKGEFTRAKDRVAKALATTPDDKINWSPSATSRTPIQQVAHAAMATTGIQGMLTGKPFPYSGPAEMDAASRKAEKEFTTREEVLALLDQSSNEYIAWLDTLTPEQIASDVVLPFGTFPMAATITFPADHLRNHAGQIEYIQTIYGDLDWHM